jgi:hypothetical protein
MPPLWQYFVTLREGQTSPSRTPKNANHGHPRTFPCIEAVLGGPRGGAIIAIFDPWRADPELAANGDVPVAAVLAPEVKKADESIPAPKARESRTPTPFPLQTAFSSGPRRGP